MRNYPEDSPWTLDAHSVISRLGLAGQSFQPTLALPRRGKASLGASPRGRKKMVFHGARLAYASGKDLPATRRGIMFIPTKHRFLHLEVQKKGFPSATAVYEIILSTNQRTKSSYLSPSPACKRLYKTTPRFHLPSAVTNCFAIRRG